MSILPGLLLALVLAFAGQFLSDFIGIDLMGLPKSPISAIMMAIILGIIIRNTLTLPVALQPGIRFGLVRVLRLGIVLLGIRLSLGEAGSIGLQALPVIIGAVTAALLIVTFLARRLGLSGKLGTLIAVGTSICGATAIVATAPTIAAKDNEVAYSVAVVTLFGVVAMLAYPFIGHWFFSGDAFKAGLFLGTSVHETAQVAGAGLLGDATEVWLKLDLMQRTSSFKFRGAVNKILSLTEEELDKGVVSASTGNYALAVAEAMRIRKRRATISRPPRNTAGRQAA